MKFLTLILILPIFAMADDWPQWRGVNRDGKSAEKGLLRKWPEGGPKKLWTVKGLGEGYASFAVVKGKLYTVGQFGDQERVLAFDVKDGKKLWEADAGGSFRESRGHGPRGTPTIDGDKLYSLAADGTLVCLNLDTGKKVWGYNILEKFGGSNPHWGISESPLIDGEKLIVVPGGKGASVVALNKRNGEVIWKSQSDRAGYSSAIAFDYGGSRKLAVLSGEAAMGLEMSTGELLWRYTKVSNRTANIATPIYSNGYVFVSSAYGTGCALIKLPGSKDEKMQEVYFNNDMMNHYNTSVLVGDYLYGATGNAAWIAMKWSTGEVAWKERAVGKGMVLFADGLLFMQSEKGIIGLAEVNPKAYTELSRFEIKIGDYPLWTQPVLSNGVLYVRDQDNLMAYQVK